MAHIEITGHSDDLIEIDGDISEEFNVYGEDSGSLVATSDGTVLRVQYTDQGVWRIMTVKNGAASLVIVQAPEDDDNNYTDKAILDGDIKWVLHGNELAS